ELRDRRPQLARFVDDEIGEAFRAPALGELLESLELSAREGGGRDDETHAVRVRKDAELRRARDLRGVGDLEAEADVRLVGAVPEHCLGIAESRERARRRRASERLERR